MVNTYFSSIYISNILDREIIFLTFFEWKCKNSSVRSENEIIWSDINMRTHIKMFQKINLCSTPMSNIFRTIECSLILIERVRKSEFYLAFHVILRRESIESRSRDSKWIKCPILYSTKYSTDSCYDTKAWSIKIIWKLYLTCPDLTILHAWMYRCRIQLHKWPSWDSFISPRRHDGRNY